MRGFKRITWPSLLLFCALLFHMAASSPWQPVAWGMSEIVAMKQLEVKDVILLPTVSSQRELTFTKPTTWNLSPASYLQVEFQHSHELQPHRSWLQIIINNQVVKHIPLTKENAEGTTLKVPLPVGQLKDTNSLVFRVEQHYTDICEDPLDPSLWTQILPSTKLVFEYTPTLPKVDLAQYPYPLIDPLTYSPARIKYLTPGIPALAEVEAMALVNTHLGQVAQKKAIHTSLAFPNQQPGKADHLVLIGTPLDNPAIGNFFKSHGGYTLQNNVWYQNGSPLGDDLGVILYYPDPQAPHRAILMVSGNTTEGVANAAKQLTSPQARSQMAGNAARTDSSWKPGKLPLTLRPRLIESENRTFRDMEFPETKVEKIYAPPITYKIPVVGDFRPKDTQLWLDLDYSYGPDMNPEFSSLELRLNNISIANIPLTNPLGETRKHASIQLPSDLIRPRNELVAQFHMLPDKYGYCVNSYVDNAWGIIHDDSLFRVEGPVGLRLPDLGYLGDIGFPYTRKDNLEETVLVLPKQPSQGTLITLLGLTTRFGRDTRLETEPRLVVHNDLANLPSNKDLLIVGEELFEAQDDAKAFQDLFLLNWPLPVIKPMLKQFKLADNKVNQLQDDGQALYLEQRLTPWDKKRVATFVFSKKEAPYLSFSRLVETDSTWETFTGGSLKQYSVFERHFNTGDYPRFYIETTRPLDPLGELPFNIPVPLFIGALLLLFVFLVMLPIWLRNMRAKRYR